MPISGMNYIKEPAKYFLWVYFINISRSRLSSFFNPAGLGSQFNYINADKASGYGAEVEYRKKLDFVEVLQNFNLPG